VQQQAPSGRESTNLTRSIDPKFHPDQIWNKGALGFLTVCRPNKNEMNTGSDMGWVPDPKTYTAINDQFEVEH